MLKHWNTNTNNMNRHPVEKESNFFNVDISHLCKTHKIYNVSSVSNVVGCGWDPGTSKMFLCINGKLTKEKELRMPSTCDIRPGFSFNKARFKNVLQSMGGDACRIEINFGRQPFVYVPAWREKLVRAHMLNMNPHLKNHFGFALDQRKGLVVDSWGCNDILKQWCIALQASSSYNSLNKTNLKLFSIYPLINAILNGDLSRVQDIMGMTNNKYFNEIDLRSTNHLINVEDGDDAQSLVNQQDGFCLSTWPVEPTKRTILHVATSVTSSTEILEFLLAVRPSDDILVATDVDGCTPLHVAARLGNIAALGRLCKTLLAKISNVQDRKRAFKHLMQQKSYGGMNMLHHAIVSGSIGTIDFILEKHNTLYQQLSIEHDQTYDVGENGKLNWSMLKSSPMHYVMFLACGILPAGSSCLNIVSYERLKRYKYEDRIEHAILLFQKLSTIVFETKPNS